MEPWRWRGGAGTKRSAKALIDDGESLVQEIVRKSTRPIESVPDVGKTLKELRRRLLKEAA